MKIPKKKKKPTEDSNLLSEDGEPQRSKKTMLPLVGEIIAFVSSGLFIFTILCTLKLEGVILWMWWLICIPLWLILFVLILLTQSKKLTTRTSLIVRLAWLLCVISIICFMVLLNLKLEHEYEPNWKLVFLPLWILFGLAFILGISGVIVALCNKEQRRRKYLLSGIPLLAFVIIFLPFTMLLEFRIEDESILWSAVFIPLWIVDSTSICFACILMLFTIGSREDATFTLSQVISFICLMPLAILFKILLVLELDGVELSYYIVMTPLLVMELLALSCGANLRYSKHGNSLNQQKDGKPHLKLKANMSEA